MIIRNKNKISLENRKNLNSHMYFSVTFFNFSLSRQGNLKLAGRQQTTTTNLQMRREKIVIMAKISKLNLRCKFMSLINTSGDT